MTKPGAKAPAGITPLRKIFNQLKKDGKIESQKQFARVTDMAETALSRMLEGTKPVPLRFLKELVLKFDVNANFLLRDGDDSFPIYISSPVTKVKELRERNDVLQSKVEDLEKRLSEKNEMIDLLKEKVGRA